MKGGQDVQNNWENKIIFFKNRKYFQAFVTNIICTKTIIIHWKKVPRAKERSLLFSNKEDLEQ